MNAFIAVLALAGDVAVPAPHELLGEPSTLVAAAFAEAEPPSVAAVESAEDFAAAFRLPAQRSYEGPSLVLKVVDADTVDVLTNVARDVYVRQRIRVLGTNAAEKDTVAGAKAKAWAERLLPPLSEVKAIDAKHDKFGGRKDGDLVLADGRVYSELLLAKKDWATEWDGQGTKPAPRAKVARAVDDPEPGFDDAAPPPAPAAGCTASKAPVAMPAGVSVAAAPAASAPVASSGCTASKPMFAEAVPAVEAASPWPSSNQAMAAPVTSAPAEPYVQTSECGPEGCPVPQYGVQGSAPQPFRRRADAFGGNGPLKALNPFRKR